MVDYDKDNLKHNVILEGPRKNRILGRRSYKKGLKGPSLKKFHKMKEKESKRKTKLIRGK